MVTGRRSRRWPPAAPHPRRGTRRPVPSASTRPDQRRGPAHLDALPDRVGPARRQHAGRDQGDPEPGRGRPGGRVLRDGQPRARTPGCVRRDPGPPARRRTGSRPSSRSATSRLVEPYAASVDRPGRARAADHRLLGHRDVHERQPAAGHPGLAGEVGRDSPSARAAARPGPAAPDRPGRAVSPSARRVAGRSGPRSARAAVLGGVAPVEHAAGPQHPRRAQRGVPGERDLRPRA